MKINTDKIILTDMDDVMVSWIAGFSRYLRDVHFPEFDIDSRPQDWDMCAWIGHGVTPPQDRELIADFNSGKYWQFGALPEFKEAVYGIWKLASVGWKFVVITSASTDPVAVNLRRANLHNLFGEAIVDLRCLNLGESKLAMLKEYEPTFWIEDKIANAEDGQIAGHCAILMNQPHNIGKPSNAPLLRVTDWYEIVGAIGTPSKRTWDAPAHGKVFA